MPKILRKRFGQHLLTDENTIDSIVQIISPLPTQTICEIGPGYGAITLPILKKIHSLHAIEIDKDLAKQLKIKCEGKGKLTLHNIDVLKFNINEEFDSDVSIRLVGNLPYNISTPLLFYLLTFSNKISDMHFMLQKEVVDRIVATPGSSEYSRLSVMIQSYYDATQLLDIPPCMFTPPPKVQSSFIRMVPNEKYSKLIKNRKLFKKIIDSAFNQRRKTIKNSLTNIATSTELESAGINPNIRPQEISIQQYISLSNQLK